MLLEDVGNPCFAVLPICIDRTNGSLVSPDKFRSTAKRSANHLPTVLLKKVLNHRLIQYFDEYGR